MGPDNCSGPNTPTPDGRPAEGSNQQSEPEVTVGGQVTPDAAEPVQKLLPTTIVAPVLPVIDWSRNTRKLALWKHAIPLLPLSKIRLGRSAGETVGSLEKDMLAPRSKTTPSSLLSWISFPSKSAELLLLMSTPGLFNAHYFV